jgi:protein gp37
VSPGCAHCYAATLSHRFGWTSRPWTQENAQENVTLRYERLDQPRRWRRPRVIFVNSMSDLFHENVPLDFIKAVFDVMAECEQHVFQVLTKRHERLAEVAPAALLAEQRVDVSRCRPGMPRVAPPGCAGCVKEPAA